MNTKETADQSLVCNADEGIDFLSSLFPEGPWDLTAIDPEGRAAPRGQTFGARPNEIQKLKDWVRRYNDKERRNIHFSVNQLRVKLGIDKRENSNGAPVVIHKACREEIAAIRALHVDLDPQDGADIKAEQDRILSVLTGPPEPIPPPSKIVFSGGGFQGFWALNPIYELPADGGGRTPREVYESAKIWNVGLEHMLGGDNCHNIDRVMRLPGTINWPNAKKREKGRVPTLAYEVKQ